MGIERENKTLHFTAGQNCTGKMGIRVHRTIITTKAQTQETERSAALRPLQMHQTRRQHGGAQTYRYQHQTQANSKRFAALSRRNHLTLISAFLPENGDNHVSLPGI